MGYLIYPGDGKERCGVEAHDPGQAQPVLGQGWVHVPGEVEETWEDDEGEEVGCPEWVAFEAPV